jgi:murein hydrolase activator
MSHSTRSRSSGSARRWALVLGSLCALAPLPILSATRAPGEEVGNAPSTSADDLRKLEQEIEGLKRTQQNLQQQPSPAPSRHERGGHARRGEPQEERVENGDLQARSITLAKVVRDNLDVLAQREAKIRTELKEQRGHLTETLAALELLERQKPPALLVKPEDATQAVRSAILLGDIVPRLKSQAEALTKQLADLKVIRDRIETEQKALEAAADALQDDQARFDTLMTEKVRAEGAVRAASTAEEQHLAELARRAENLSALVEGLRNEKTPEEPRPKPQRSEPPGASGTQLAGVWSSPGSAPKTFADARGQLRMPAVGKVVAKFGVPNESGGTTKGIKIGTLPGAPIVMPFDGRVKYAGPLKTYGQVLIVQTGDDYLIILAGMARIDAEVGQWLLAGEPVGRMAESGEDGPDELYLEFRKGREPFDPLPWLAGVTKEG